MTSCSLAKSRYLANFYFSLILFCDLPDLWSSQDDKFFFFLLTKTKKWTPSSELLWKMCSFLFWIITLLTGTLPVTQGILTKIDYNLLCQSDRYECGLKSSYDDVISVVDFFTNGNQALQHQWMKCVDCKEDYVEKWTAFGHILG